jgi:hypothetical protein
MPNDSIVFSDDEKVWCDEKYCGGKLIPYGKDGTMICSLCEHVYLPDSVMLHKSDLRPDKSRHDSDRDSGSIAVSMTEYSEKPTKKPTILDREDMIFVRQGSGRSIIDYEEWLPEGEKR